MLYKEVLFTYYDRCFPSILLWRWLTKGESREFACRLNDENRTFVRKLTFDSGSNLRRFLLHKVPMAIEAGPIHVSSISLHRELVFDIDLSDYPAPRECCGGPDARRACQKCWPIASAGMEVMNDALTKGFGFKQVYFVYSGRRGFHCWVMDPHCTNVLDTQYAREAVVSYVGMDSHKWKRPGDVWIPVYRTVRREEVYDFQLRRNVERDVVIHQYHPSIERAYNILEPVFAAMCEQKDCFVHLKGPSGYEWLLRNFNVIHVPYFKNLPRLKRCTSNQDMWPILKKAHSIFLAKYEKPPFQIVNLLIRIVFYYMYPRIDTSVTVQMNHLLKLPFNVHPDTGRICIPIELTPTLPISTKTSFDPQTVITIDQLHEDVLRSRDGHWTSTRIAPFIKQFAASIEHRKEAKDATSSK